MKTINVIKTKHFDNVNMTYEASIVVKKMKISGFGPTFKHAIGDLIFNHESYFNASIINLGLEK